MGTTLPLFWNLSSSSKNERLDASVKLISAMEHFQLEHLSKKSEAGDGDEDENMENEDESSIDRLNAQDVAYSLRRLVRGLASPRESSRLGFVVALTELLARLDTVSCSNVISLLEESTRGKGSMTGQEERDVLFAQLFGLTAIIQSGLLVRTKPLAASPSSPSTSSTVDTYFQVVNLLIVLGEKKAWLRESAWWSLSLALDAVLKNDVPWREEAMKWTLDKLFVEQKTWSSEKLALACKLQTSLPHADWRQMICPPFKSPTLLASANLLDISRILKEEQDLEDENGKKVDVSASSYWQPRLHFAWDVLLEQLLSSEPSSSLSFQEFYRVAVDGKSQLFADLKVSLLYKETLFSNSASVQRKYWGFLLVQKALARVDPAEAQMLFTKNFMRSWINHLSSPDRYLHKIARQVAMDVSKLVKEHPETGLPFILQLTGANGNIHFDRITKTRTVSSVVSSMNSEGIKDYVDYLLSQVNAEKVSGKSSTVDVKEAETRRMWIVDHVCALIRNASIPRNDAWIQEILSFLALNGLFTFKSGSSSPSYIMTNPILSDALRAECRRRLLACLADLSSQSSTPSSQSSKKRHGVASDGMLWISKVVTLITEHFEKGNCDFVTTLDEEMEALQNKALKLVKKLAQGSDNKDGVHQGAQILLQSLVLECYCVDEDKANIEALETCMEGASKLPLLKKKKKSSQKDVNGAEQTNEEKPVDLLLDCIIGMMEKPSAYLRTMGNIAFSFMTEAIEDSSVDLILAQLERRSPNELSEDTVDEDSESDIDAEDVGEDDSQDSSDSDNNDSESSEDNAEVDEEFRAKVEQALQVNGAHADDQSSDEEELMDDSQMMALDEQLADVFRTQMEGRKTGKTSDVQREATHFKNRILDLVDSYVKNQPTNSLVLRLILPLVELIRSSGSDERQLADKASGILKNRICKSKDGPSFALHDVTPVLQRLHEIARKAFTPELLGTLSRLSLYVSKSSDDPRQSIETYKDSFKDFSTRKNSALNPSFFLPFLHGLPEIAWSMRQSLVDLAENAVNGYRTCQIFQMSLNIVNDLPLDHPSYQEEMSNFLPLLQEGISKSLRRACDGKATLTTQQVRELLKACSSTSRRLRRFNLSWQKENWENLATSLASSSRYKDSGLPALCHQLALTVDTEQRGLKRKQSELSENAKRKKRRETRDGKSNL